MIPAALQAHYDTGNTCMAVGLLVQRLDGEIFGLTSSSVPLILDLTPWDGGRWNLAGLTEFEFNAKHGLNFGSLESTAGFEVDETDFETLNNGTLFSEDDLLAGRWNSANFRLFLYRWDVEEVTIANDIETLKVGTFGQPKIETTKVKVELRCLKQQMQLMMGIVSQPNCRVRVFSQGSGKCNKDPTGFVHTFEVSSVADQGVFSAADADQPDDYFGYGYVRWLTGENKDLEMRVSQFSGGQFTLSASAVLPIAVGDQFEATAGCRGRWDADCRDKFENILNFQGEKDRPTQDRVVSGVGG